MTPSLHGFGLRAGVDLESRLASGDAGSALGSDTPRRPTPPEILADFLDSILSSAGETVPAFGPGVLEQRQDLQGAFEALPESKRRRLSSLIPSSELEQIFSLSHETDLSLFYQDLHALGLRLSRQGRSELAMLLFNGIAQGLERDFPGRPSDHAALAARARRELDAMMGRGAVAPRVEHLMRGLAQEASNPVMLASMGVAGLAFSTVRLGMLSRLMSSGSGGFFTRGFGARALASTFGFAAEVPAFVFSGRGLNEALGVSQDWSLRGVGRDLATAGITLSALKLSGAGARSLMGRMEGNSAFTHISRGAIPQVATLGGLMLGHRMEEGLGLRPHVDGATTFVDSLSTLLMFHVSGRLLHHAMGPNYARMQREMELQSELLSRRPRARPESGDRPPLAGILEGMFGARQPALAGVGVAEGRESRSERFPNVLLMEMNGGDGEGGGSTKSRPSSRPSVRPPERLTSRRPSPTLMEQALQMASEEGRGQKVIRVTQQIDETGSEPVAEAEAIESFPHDEAQPTLKSSRPEVGEAELQPAEVAVQAKVPVRIPRLVNGTRVGPEGRFEIAELLSEGANGTVYRVIDTRGGRSAAIKVPKHGNQETDIDRFEREIWISENLASGWAVPIYDHFEIVNGSGIQIPLMEYVDGETLGRILHRLSINQAGVLHDYSLERRVDLFADLCLGVQDAHQHGVLHNDLKPDNLMVDRNMRMRILDWGLARHIGESLSEGRGSLSAEALRRKPPRASVSSMAGTPGYMAPEVTTTNRGSNLRSQDIFSLGVILYEMATGMHPFGLYRPGNLAANEARLVPIRYGDHPQGQTKINPRAVFSYGVDRSLDPPSFQDILTGSHPDYLFELEAISRRAMDPDPAKRFQNASELREAVLMARAFSDREALNQLRSRRQEAEGLTRASWRRFNVASQIEPAEWTRMHQLIRSLRADRASWHQGVEDLVTRLSEVMKYDQSQAARRMIAELSWERLVDGGDLMAQSVRKALERRIRDNDFPLRDGEPQMFSDALSGRVALDLRLSDIANGATWGLGKLASARVSVSPILREVDAQGFETGTYREGGVAWSGSLLASRETLQLSHGYYVITIQAEGYGRVRLPLRVTRQDVMQFMTEKRALDANVEMVPQSELSAGMALVPGGNSFTGLDFYEEGMPSNIYSFPMHEIQIGTFAISKKPVTVAEYIPFIESLLQQGRVADARIFLPRRNLPPIRVSRDLIRDAWRVFREEGYRAALEHFLNRQRGYSYNWKIRPQGFGPWKSYRLQDPTSHLDANGDPITSDQPISAISRIASEAFLKWLSEKEGRTYDLPTAEEKEKVDRNSFPWNFPWGYDFAPFYLISRLAFSGNLVNSTYPQPVGKHVMDQEMYRDFTLYGTLDNLGNVREYTGSNGEPSYVVLSGGSVRVPYGPFYYPASRNYAHRETSVDDSVGAFRRVLRFGRPRPRDLSSDPPPSKIRR